MILGFTGSRRGMSIPQLETFDDLVSHIEKDITAFLNGCCIGADRDALSALRPYTHIRIELYPGDSQQEYWAKAMYNHTNNFNTTIHRTQNYLQRNRLIVRRCDYLIATPQEAREVQRSGTWTTIRYARAAESHLTIILPDGTLQEENR